MRHIVKSLTQLLKFDRALGVNLCTKILVSYILSLFFSDAEGKKILAIKERD